VKSQRAVSAVVGAFVADAATRPAHWVYDRSVIETVMGNSDPEFWPTSLSPFYSLPTGRRSCYSDEAFVMLEALLKPPYCFNKADAEAYLQKFFSPDSEYADALARRQVAYDPARRTEERQPIPGPWQQAVITHYLKSVVEGKSSTAEPNSSETDGFCFSMPLAASLSIGESNDFDETVKAAVKILTTSETAVVHSSIRARILRALIRCHSNTGAGVTGIIAAERRDLIQELITQLEDEIVTSEWNAVVDKIPAHPLGPPGETISAWGSASLSPEFLDAVQEFGKPCADPGNFKSALLALVTCTSFTEGVRRNLLAGGCNCSRSVFLGACLGAAYGLGEENGVPLEWLARTDQGERVFDMALSLFEIKEASATAAEKVAI